MYVKYLHPSPLGSSESKFTAKRVEKGEEIDLSEKS